MDIALLLLLDVLFGLILSNTLRSHEDTIFTFIVFCLYLIFNAFIITWIVL